MAFKFNPFTGQFDLVDTAPIAKEATYEFGRTGIVPDGSYLFSNSNGGYTSGPRVGLSSAEIQTVTVSNSINDTYDVEIYEFDGTTRTLLTTLNVVASRGQQFSPSSISLTQGQEILVRILNGDPKDVNVNVVVEGA